MTIAPPSPKYVGPVKWHGPDDNKPIKRVVIHGTVSPCERGGARKISNYFKITNRPSSAHYVVDPGEILQCVYDSVVAFHAPPNHGSIGVELCDPVVGSIDRWDDLEHREMLLRATFLVARLCLAYDVPIRKVGRIGLRLGRKGITGHVDVGKAFGQTSHWDPGAFPWRRFIADVRSAASAIERQAANADAA